MTFYYRVETFCKSPYKVMQATNNYWAPTKCKTYTIKKKKKKLEESSGPASWNPKALPFCCLACMVRAALTAFSLSAASGDLWPNHRFLSCCETGITFVTLEQTHDEWLVPLTSSSISLLHLIACKSCLLPGALLHGNITS